MKGSFRRDGWLASAIRILRSERGEVGDPPADNDPPKDPSAPSPSPSPEAERIARLEAQVGQFFDRFDRFLDGYNPTADRTPPPIERDDPEPTAAELEAAIAEGRGADLIQRKIDAAVRKLSREQINPLRSQGQSALVALAKQVTLSSKKHYARYKKEIDAAIDRLPEEVRINPQVHEALYNTIVGQHFDELEREATERALRGGDDSDPAATPSARRGAPLAAATVPSPEELLGADAAAALEAAGRTPDEFARRLGYGSWEGYVKVHKEFNEKGGTQGNA